MFYILLLSTSFMSIFPCLKKIIINVYVVIFGVAKSYDWHCHVQGSMLSQRPGTPGPSLGEFPAAGGVAALKVVSALNRKPSSSQTSPAAPDRDLSLSAPCGPHFFFQCSCLTSLVKQHGGEAGGGWHPAHGPWGLSGTSSYGAECPHQAVCEAATRQDWSC